jgi:hypothetical protein
MARDYSSCPGIEKNIIDIGGCAKMGETPAGFLEFLNVLNPNELVIRKPFEDLIRRLHSRFESPSYILYKSSKQPIQLACAEKKAPYDIPCRPSGNLY